MEADLQQQLEEEQAQAEQARAEAQRALQAAREEFEGVSCVMRRSAG